MKPTRSDHVSDEDLARRGLSRETDLVLDAQGRWRTDGYPVEHPGVAAAFSRWIERDESGRYVLRTDLHYVYVAVEGAPLHAVRLEEEGDALLLVLAGGEREPLRPETLREGPDGTLYASGRDGSWPVWLGPQVVLGLAPYLEEEGDAVFFVQGGRRGVVPRVGDPLS